MKVAAELMERSHVGGAEKHKAGGQAAEVAVVDAAAGDRGRGAVGVNGDVGVGSNGDAVFAGLVEAVGQDQAGLTHDNGRA